MHKKLIWLLALIGLAFVTTSCVVDDPATSEVESHVIGPATLGVDQPSYTFASPVTLTWSGMTTNATDWVAIAPAGSPLTTITKWTYTNGAASGSVQLEGPGSGGSYVARGFSNDSYTLQGESDPFTVQDPGSTMATLSANQTTYGLADPISITWSGLPGNQQDWIAIAPQGWPVNDQADWQYTGGGTSGTTVFPDGLAPTGYPGGSYVARAYLNNTFTLVGQSAPFVIGSLVTTNKSAYNIQENITVTWQNLPGNAQDWIALAPAGSPATTVTRWVYTGGAAMGSTTFFSGLASAGSYVARAFVNDTYVLLGESPVFTVNAVANATVTTNMQMYTVGQFVVVTWSGLPGNMLDWISLAPVGAPNSTTTRWRYTGGAASGSLVFEGPAAGTYEARAFINDSYTRLATSGPFVVQ